MQKLSAIKHLSREDIVKNGSIFTPACLVELVSDKLKGYITKDSVIADFGSGYGAFAKKFENKGKRFFGTEFDKLSIEFLHQEFPNVIFYEENSLLDISRVKYEINEEDELIVVGNPPYNDITSIYKKGEKGILNCDDDVISRDFGISFMKAYNKLNAKYICILHPLAYLIKKTNFNSLGSFRNNYKLLSATVFSSQEFESIKKTNAEFPVIAALYERNNMGMEFDDIKKFQFDIYNSNKKFCLNEIMTIDGYVEKYPKKDSKMKLQFYTLRDMNALMRNAGFVEERSHNGLDVDIDNIYQYAWLFFLKSNFSPLENKFLYGNLSPLYTKKMEEDVFKQIVVSYAYNNCSLVSKYISKDEIEKKYGEIMDDYSILYDELTAICKY